MLKKSRQKPMSNSIILFTKMADVKLICVYIILFLNYLTCNEIMQIHRSVAGLKNQSIEMYGEVRQDWQNQNLADRLLYPKGDRDKLSLLSSLWRDYYDCLVRTMHKLTIYLQLPGVILMVYLGATARLSCAICIAPGELVQLQWMFSESITNTKFSPLKENDRTIRDGANITIHNVRASDAGLYRCQIGDSSSLLVVEVVDTEEKYTLVKPRTSRGPYASPPHLNNGLIVFSSWTLWSECSVCDKVGRRHRYGMCYVRMQARNRVKSQSNDTKHNGSAIFRAEIVLFEAFPGGIPCRSQYLPQRISEINDIKKRQSEIMIAMCKVPCYAMVFQAVSTDERVLETANNSAGLYSLEQPLPKQPPLPARDIIFAQFGQQIAIRCPGNSLRDVPITWRSGTKPMVPREIDKVSGGRVLLNCRGHLIITKVLYRDANLYSCWQHEKLAGTVKLRVRRTAQAWCNHHVLLVVLIVTALVVLRVCERAWRRVQHKQFILYHLQ